MISIHSLVRGRTFRSSPTLFHKVISIPSLVRGRTPLKSISASSSPNFNPLPRKRENDIAAPSVGNSLYFNPLPRKRENENGGIIPDSNPISIHSLVRGRTWVYTGVTDSQAISIHSLVRGRTQRSNFRLAISTNFNPLPRKRENAFNASQSFTARYFNPLPRKRENGGYDQAVSSTTISIHSLVRGRTLHLYRGDTRKPFQSTPS